MQRTFVLLLSCLALAAAPRTPQPERALAGVRTVYILSMGRGFDQFLANHLTGTGIVDVVTDPQRADAVLTDRIGQGFEQRMRELFPPEEPAAPKESKESASKEAKPENQESAPMGSAKAPPVGQLSSFSRGKGNVFLVDTRTSLVIWSTYEPSVSGAPDLDRAASRVVAKLKKSMAVRASLAAPVPADTPAPAHPATPAKPAPPPAAPPAAAPAPAAKPAPKP